MDINKIDTAIAKQRNHISKLRDAYQTALSRQEDYRASNLRHEIDAALRVSAELDAVRRRETAGDRNDSSALRPSSYFVGGHS